ncbi:MAG: transcriptional regulator [Micromonosporaceae bacterium]|nr:transcriptional regulator [Micromonosporaceae bacterium]
MSHLIGLAFARYVVKIEPLASTSVEELVALVAPVVQRCFDPVDPA